MLENDRQPIPDVPAVYFVRATEESVLRIADDAARGLYDSMHLNFTPALPRALMERLAAATVASNSAQRIAKVRCFLPHVRDAPPAADQRSQWTSPVLCEVIGEPIKRLT